jgi:transposase
MKDIFSKALGINSPWYVEDIRFDEANKRLEISLNFERGATFSVEGIPGEHKAYDTVEKEWRHLNFFQHECILKARVPRIKTPDGEVRLVTPEWSGLANGFTLLFEALILQLAQHMPVHQVAKLINASDHKVWAILDTYTAKARSLEDYSSVTKLGVDETSIAKGHQYISLFVDLEKRRTLFVADGKDSDTFKQFKEDFMSHGGNVDQISDISCDMSPAFIKGAREHIPEAEVTFDKFHILKVINNAVDQVRKEEARNNPLLKGTKFLFLKNEGNLTANQKRKKEELSLPKLNLKSLKALAIREAFQAIYAAETYHEFEKLLNGWYFWATHSRLEPIIKAAKTIKNHWDGVLRWKLSKINNGILEGLNSVVQATKRKARGYKSKHFKTIVYLITSNLDFSKLNPEYSLGK